MQENSELQVVAYVSVDLVSFERTYIVEMGKRQLSLL